jgi:surfactin synthase thioesterase subunit
MEWPEIIDAVSTLVRGELDRAPAGFYVFFGHSFGALLAFEVARAFHVQNQSLPTCLFLSAHRAAHLRSHHRGERQRHSLAHEHFVDMVREWGFVSDEVLENEDVLKFILPPLRSDLRLDELYKFEPGDPLPVHCFVSGGETDHSVSRDELKAWSVLFCSRYRFEAKLYPGGHFYTVDCENELLANISRHLAEVLETDKFFATRHGSVDCPTSRPPDPC